MRDDQPHCSAGSDSRSRFRFNVCLRATDSRRGGEAGCLPSGLSGDQSICAEPSFSPASVVRLKSEAVLRTMVFGTQRVQRRKRHKGLSTAQQLCIHVDETPDTIVFHPQSRATCHQQMIQESCHTLLTSFIQLGTIQRQPQRLCRALVTHTPSVMIKVPELLARRSGSRRASPLTVAVEHQCQPSNCTSACVRYSNGSSWFEARDPVFRVEDSMLLHTTTEQNTAITSRRLTGGRSDTAQRGMPGHVPRCTVAKLREDS